MVNILLPAMGDSMFFKDYYFPKLMIEIDGETVLEKVINNYETVIDKHFIFVLNQKECTEFHIDQSIKVMTESDSSILVLKNQTKGALCTCLIAIKEINLDAPLIVANHDQIIDINYQDVIDRFINKGNWDAGVITFPSIHPRWSYVRLDRGVVVEVAEKRPLSKHAIAGFYYFKRGSDFIEAGKRAILKESMVNGKYYISSSLNEMILMNKRIGYFEIKKEQYHSFYSPDKIMEYQKFEQTMKGRSEDERSKTE